MPRILLLFAHPALEKSRVNRTLIEGLEDIPDLTFRDLYEEYPDFYIDVQREQELLLMHDIIIWQHPLYWYSVPPLLKQWIDLTLEHRWAYGKTGVFLKGKKVLSVITSGGSEASYAPGAFNKHDLRTFLLPLERTAELCSMQYLPPYIIPGTHLMDAAGIATAQKEYLNFLRMVQKGHYAPESWEAVDFANQLAQ